MPTVNVKTAKLSTRKLVRNVGYIRRELSAASAAEQKGTQGAKQTREELSAKFARCAAQATSDITDTEAISASYRAISRDLRSSMPPSTTKGRLAAILGLSVEHRTRFATLFIDCADEATRSADFAQNRLDDTHDDIAATACHIGLLAKLPDHGFDMNHPALKADRQTYNNYTTAARKRRQK